MDEDFFFPANVRAEYTLGPLRARHLRRAGWGGGLALVVLIVGLFNGGNILLLSGIIGFVGGIFALAYCLPLDDDETALDLLFIMFRMSRTQATFKGAGELPQEPPAISEDPAPESDQLPVNPTYRNPENGGDSVGDSNCGDASGRVAETFRFWNLSGLRYRRRFGAAGRPREQDRG